MVSPLRMIFGFAAGSVLLLGCSARETARAEGEAPTLSVPTAAQRSEPAVAAVAARPDEPKSAESDAEEATAVVRARAPRAERADRRGRRRRSPPTTSELSSAGEAELRVSRLTMARSVSAREPVGPATSFHAAEARRLFAFVELTSEAPVESEITVTLTSSQGAPQEVKLAVGAERRWRTWAALRPRGADDYVAIVRNARGRVLARTAFQVTP